MHDLEQLAEAAMLQTRESGSSEGQPELEQQAAAARGQPGSAAQAANPRSASRPAPARTSARRAAATAAANAISTSANTTAVSKNATGGVSPSSKKGTTADNKAGVATESVASLANTDTAKMEEGPGTLAAAAAVQLSSSTARSDQARESANVQRRQESSEVVPPSIAVARPRGNVESAMIGDGSATTAIARPNLRSARQQRQQPDHRRTPSTASEPPQASASATPTTSSFHPSVQLNADRTGESTSSSIYNSLGAPSHHHHHYAPSVASSIDPGLSSASSVSSRTSECPPYVTMTPEHGPFSLTNADPLHSHAHQHLVYAKPQHQHQFEHGHRTHLSHGYDERLVYSPPTSRYTDADVALREKGSQRIHDMPMPAGARLVAVGAGHAGPTVVQLREARRLENAPQSLYERQIDLHNDGFTDLEPREQYPTYQDSRYDMTTTRPSGLPPSARLHPSAVPHAQSGAYMRGLADGAASQPPNGATGQYQLASTAGPSNSQAGFAGSNGMPGMVGDDSFATDTSGGLPLTVGGGDFDNEGASEASSSMPAPVKKQKGRRPTGENPDGKNHKCSFPGCAWSFNRREHLRRHEKTHTQDRPYVCDIPYCGLRFSRADNLTSHRRTHDKGKRTTQWHVAKVVSGQAAEDADGGKFGVNMTGKEVAAAIDKAQSQRAAAREQVQQQQELRQQLEQLQQERRPHEVSTAMLAAAAAGSNTGGMNGYALEPSLASSSAAGAAGRAELDRPDSRDAVLEAHLQQQQHQQQQFPIVYYDMPSTSAAGAGMPRYAHDPYAHLHHGTYLADHRQPLPLHARELHQPAYQQHHHHSHQQHHHQHPLPPLPPPPPSAGGALDPSLAGSMNGGNEHLHDDAFHEHQHHHMQQQQQHHLHMMPMHQPHPQDPIYDHHEHYYGQLLPPMPELRDVPPSMHSPDVHQQHYHQQLPPSPPHAAAHDRGMNGNGNGSSSKRKRTVTAWAGEPPASPGTAKSPPTKSARRSGGRKNNQTV